MSTRKRARVDCKRKCYITPNRRELKKRKAKTVKYGSYFEGKVGRVGITSLHEAAEDGDAELVKKVLDDGENVNAKDRKGRTPLHLAVIYKNMGNVKLLLDWGADVNAADKVGKRPLHIASACNDAEMIDALLSKGACLEAKDEYGMTPLYDAVLCNNIGNVKFLLDWGADVNAVNGERDTPLHYAAHCSDPEINDVLLSEGASLEAKGEYGMTPLHYASLYDKFKNVKLLLDWGANFNAVDQDGDTPVDYSCNKVATILREQVIKLRAANFFVCCRNLEAVKDNDKLTSFQCACEEEIDRMKKEKIFNDISVFDVLTCLHVNRLAAYARNKSIVKVLKSYDCRSKFPIYDCMVKGRFRLGIQRKESLDRGLMIFRCPSAFRDLPLVCHEKILDYLSNKELNYCYKAAFLSQV